MVRCVRLSHCGGLEVCLRAASEREERELGFGGSTQEQQALTRHESHGSSVVVVGPPARE